MELKLEKKTESADDSDEYDFITVPTDGGYGWAVLAACFVSFSLSVGLDQRNPFSDDQCHC